MKNFKFSLPLLMIAGFSFAGTAFAHSPAHKAHVAFKPASISSCALGDPTDVCVINNTPDMINVEIRVDKAISHPDHFFPWNLRKLEFCLF